MERKHLFEFEDLEWYPSFFRDGTTRFLKILFKISRIYNSTYPMVEDLLLSSKSKVILDLMSGAGGPQPGLTMYLRKKGIKNFKVILSDLRPNINALKSLEHSDHSFKFHETPIDATNSNSSEKKV